VKSRPIYDRLQEDLSPRGNALCFGCGVDLAFRFMLRVLGGKDLILQCAMGCAHITAASAMTATVSSLLPTAPSLMTGYSRYLRKIGKEHLLVAFLGDGTTCDIGFQTLSAAAERGEHLIYMCYDNEAYQNTGVQKSSTTPYGAWTTTTPVGTKSMGKKQEAKNVPLIMAMHGIPYAATVSISHLEDFAQKVEKAKEAVKDGFVYLHLLGSCPTGWRFPTEHCIEVDRTAVETNYFPLWEAERGKLRLTYQPKVVKPITEFTKMQGRFRHLTKQQLDEFQKTINNKFVTIEALAKVGV